MIRSQIYLTEDERNSLKLISKETGRTQSDLIREAVDSLISRIKNKDNNEKRKEAFGMWKDKDDYPNIKEVRKEFDRTF
jgi:predicted DNA-binding protein